MRKTLVASQSRETQVMSKSLVSICILGCSQKGKEMSRMIIDMTGKKIGKWIVLERAGRDKYGAATWACRCDCGKKGVVRGYSLQSGGSKGCKGCASREKNMTHGESKTRLYSVWGNIRERCGNKNCSNYKYYGGRGIKVCPTWNESFEVFRDWSLANGYGKSLSIDRIDNDKGYSTDNCRWATKKQQQRNRRDNRYLTVNGITKLICEWAETVGISHHTLWSQYRIGWRGERLLKPLGESDE